MSVEKILECLEDHPAGLSISNLAEETGLHRNTISPKIKELVEEGKVEKKKVGTAKIYYLEKHSGIHEMESQYEGENIQVGIGVSDLSDGFRAAQSAAKQAANQAASGERPTFSLVFVSSEYNDQIEDITKGFNKILGEDWIGCTSDRELNSILGYSQGTIQVLSINSKYLHFSPVLVENYREAPKKKAEEATQKAVDQANVERSVHATSQYMRSTKKEFSDIIKNPPYFVLTYISGIYYEEGEPVMGFENEFLNGIKNILGNYIPIVGGSATSDAGKLEKGEGTNYVFANGKFSKSGAVLCFGVSELYFSYGLAHGYDRTNKISILSEVTDNNRGITKLSGENAIDKYCEMIDVSKSEFIENYFRYTTRKPLCSLDDSQNIYPKVIPNVFEESGCLQGTFKFTEGQSVLIGEYNEEKSLNSLKNSFDDALSEQEFEPALALISNCSVRRVLLKKKVNESISRLEDKYPNLPFFGFYTAGEIGSYRDEPPKYNNITCVNLIFSDKLQTE